MRNCKKTNISVELTPVQEDQGTMNITVDWRSARLPADSITKIEASLITRENDVKKSIRLVRNEHTVTISETLDSGYYVLNLNFKKGNYLYASVFEIVKVFNNQSSVKVILLGRNDFSCHPLIL